MRIQNLLLIGWISLSFSPVRCRPDVSHLTDSANNLNNQYQYYQYQKPNSVDDPAHQHHHSSATSNYVKPTPPPAPSRIDLPPPAQFSGVHQQQQQQHANGGYQHQQNHNQHERQGQDLLRGEQTNAQLSFSKAISSPVSSSQQLSDGSIRIGNLRQTIPGEPNVDYPIYSEPPESSFQCIGRHDGYYADVEARCQVFRVCANTDLTGKGFAFLCPNGTIFNQQYFVCDWYNNVNCGDTEQFYVMNEQLGKRIDSHSEMMKTVKAMLEYTVNKAFISGVSGVNNPPTSNQLQLQPPKKTQDLTTTSDGRLKAVSGGGKSGLRNGFSFGIPSSPIIITTTTTTTTSPPLRISGNVDASSSATSFGNDNRNVAAIPQQKVYVSSLGELSTDFNSGFDINKSKFLVANQEQDKTESATTNRELLDQILEDQVALIAQNLNQNKLASPVQINNALLASTNQFGVPPTEIPRLISSKNIIPLPKSFPSSASSSSRFIGSSQKPSGVVSNQHSIATFTETNYTPSNSQFPAPQLPFPHPFQQQQQQQSYHHPSPLLQPPGFGQQYQNSINQHQQQQQNQKPTVQSGFHSAANVNALQGNGNVLRGTTGTSSNPSSGVQLSTQNKDATSNPNNINIGIKEKQSEKQIFTYPLTKSQPSQTEAPVVNVRFGDENAKSFTTPPSKFFSLPFGPEERGRSLSDQQLANSAVSQIVSFEKKINGQVPQASSHFFTVDSSPKPYYQNQHLSLFPSTTPAPVAQPPFIKSSYPQSIINNPPLTSELRILNTINYNTTPLPKILPSVTQQFYESQDQDLSSTQYNGFRSRADNRNYQRYDHHRFGGNENRKEESVVVKVVPAYGFYLNDAKEREAYFEAVSRGLLDDNGYIYVNNVQQNSDSSIPITTTIQQKADSFSPIVQSQQGFFNGHNSNNNNRFFTQSGLNQNHQQQQSFTVAPGQSNRFSNVDIVPTMITTHYTQHSGNNFGKNMYANNYNHQIQQQQQQQARNNAFRQNYQSQGRNFNQNGFQFDERPSIFKGFSSYNAPLSSVGRLENDSDSVTGRGTELPSFRRNPQWFRNKRKLGEEGAITNSVEEVKSNDSATSQDSATESLASEKS